MARNNVFFEALVDHQQLRDNYVVVEISLGSDQLLIRILGWSRWWCLKSRLEIPLTHIRSVRSDGDLPKGFWIRLPGTYIPGLIKAGIYTNGGGRWSFWDIRRARNRIIVFELFGWKYDLVVVEVENPAATIAMVQGALEPVRSTYPQSPDASTSA
jgi:hypothetical protein